MKISCNVSFRGTSYEHNIDFDVPSVCPHCGEIMNPNRITSGLTSNHTNDNHKTAAIVFNCTTEQCRKYFVLAYDLFLRDGRLKSSLIPYHYRPPISSKLPENIEKVSPDFVDIYSQATIAESEKLNQVAGVGYRKAAEFLIKDYAILRNSDDNEEIKNMFLNNVIKKYLNDFPKVQKLATAIAWIGNDETHYTRRHNDKDIQDLKKFILSAAQFIAADYDVDEAFEFTSSR